MRTIIFIAVIISVIFVFRQVYHYNQCPKCECKCDDKSQETKRLQKIIDADKNIFEYIRCINEPQTPSCKDVEGGNVCRSRQIDCNQYKLFLEQDPLTMDRMKEITRTV